MSRNRTPTALLALRGSLRDPRVAARREGEPLPDAQLGEPPIDMPVEVKETWREVVRLCHRDVLCDSDALVIESLSYLLTHLRMKQFDVHPAKLARFESMLGKLGMTPADRSRVARRKKDDVSPFQKFRSQVAA